MQVLYAYISNPVWLGGLLLDVAGGGAMLGALAAAPVSLVQPVAAFGLVLLAAFSHFVLQVGLYGELGIRDLVKGRKGDYICYSVTETAREHN